MKILLIGEYSNVHWTLAAGLRTLGPRVTVLSNGDFWKNYPRDISLVRHEGRLGGMLYTARLYSILPRLRGYDVVQVINPMFLELKAERIFAVYDYLRRHNGRMVLGGFGMDWYWVNTCCTKMPLRYSDFNIGKTLRDNADALKERKDWLGTAKERLNKHIANDCDGIITGLYEYQVCYAGAFPEKTTFIPFPIKPENRPLPERPATGRIKVFIGINRTRSAYKGTDIMLRAAQRVARRYPDRMELVMAESVPLATYRHMMDTSDLILDQLYSYTPAMNALLAMAKGIVCVGGGEPESYDILHETELRPIINVRPDEESVAQALEGIVLNPARLPLLKRQSMEYVRRRHDYNKVARRYEAAYRRLEAQGQASAKGH